jgi:hypothetical protein
MSLAMTASQDRANSIVIASEARQSQIFIIHVHAVLEGNSLLLEDLRPEIVRLEQKLEEIRVSL